ncbi:MAG: hypothetical protein MJZ58_01045 [Paludibacteraceae bacterium]|nr:hypothetical protein [Paludibacteraceae bacterium]
MRKYLLLFAVCALSLVAQAQVGKAFWFAAPWMNSHHTGEAEFHLILSAYESDAHVRITQPANNDRLWADTIVKAHSYLDIIIAQKSDHKSFAEQNIEAPYNEIANRGLYISADHQIGCYYQITHANGEAYTLKGENALGVEFVIMSQNKFANQVEYSGYKSHNNSIQIVASEDDTQVTITPSQPIFQDDGTTSSNPITVTLQRGQTYAVKAASNTAAAHLIGTVVTANKPIAVTTSDDSVIAGNGQDAVGDQLVPTDFAGTDYTVIPLPNSAYESLYIIALNDNTSATLISATDTTTITLNRLEPYAANIKSATYVHADKPIQVFQFINRLGESGGTILPQMLCTGSRQVTYKRIPNSDLAMMNILTKTENINYFYINGNEVDPALFSPVPGTDEQWSYVSLNVTSKPAAMPLELEAKKGVFQLGVVDHAALPQGTLTYGFFSNYSNASTIEVAVDESLLDTTYAICEGQPITMVALTVEGVDNLRWYKDGQLVHEGDTLAIESVRLEDDGHYSVQGDSHECTVEYKEFSFHVVAAQQTIPLTSVVISDGESYTWPVNGKTYTQNTKDTVWFPIMFNGEIVYGCDSACALEVKVLSCPQVEISYPADVCGDEANIYISYQGADPSTLRAVNIVFPLEAEKVGWVSGAVVYDESQITIPIPNGVWANPYTASLQFIPKLQDCETVTIPLSFLVHYPTSVFTQKWNDVLAVYNERYNRNGLTPGYDFVGFQWYKNGQPIDGATGSYYYCGPTDQLDFNAIYSVLLTRTDGSQIISCDYQPTHVDVPDKVGTRKVMHRGQIYFYIQGQDRMFNAQGIQVQ